MAELCEYLTQAAYEDSNGHDFNPRLIDRITTYRPLSDGFYDWICAECAIDHRGRAGWPVNGTVHECGNCGASNLLLSNEARRVNDRIKEAQG
jgi:hypothetical protein